MYGDKISWFRRFMQRFEPTSMAIVKAELFDAETAALHSQSMAEYATLRVKIHDLTTDYHKDRVVRLRTFVLAHTDPDDIQPSQRVPDIEFKTRAGFQ